MAKFSKSVRGEWLKTKDLVEGSKITITGEIVPHHSKFRDKETGENQIQNVGKVMTDSKPGEFNYRFNNTTIEALIDAYGEDSKDWMGIELTVKLEAAMVNGKRMKTAYLLPQGYCLKEDDQQYVHIVPIEANA